MPTKITWFGHNCWSIAHDKHTILLDPFLNESPTAPVKAESVLADFILVSHGHFDHISDAAGIAHRTGATVISNFEICEWLKKRGVAEDKVVPLNLGGAVQLSFGRVKMTLAHHSSALPDGTYGGNPGGFLLELAGLRLYFACDTALFLDMKLIGVGGLDLAVVPIGDVFTMGPDDALEAIKWLNPKRVAPCHYNTFPPIQQDADAWARQIRAHTAAEPLVLKPGGTFALS
jgi:L-ascorbate metabolism protein UlaG (beta-lactamase superfamily)